MTTPKTTPMTRAQVLAKAIADHSEGGWTARVVSSANHPEYPDTISTKNNPYPVYNFGVYWSRTPHRLNVVTYGPRVLFADHEVVGYDPSVYECWAS